MYLDLVFLLNFLVDLFLLLATNRMTGYPSDYKRLIAAALVGGVYGGACMVPVLGFLNNNFWRIGFLILIIVIAFGWYRDTIKRGFVFLMLCMALGGAVSVVMGENAKTAAFFAFCLFGLFHFIFRHGMHGQEFASVEIANGSNIMKLTALRDTGNCLHDPISGEPVLIIGVREAALLTGLEESQIHSPMDTVISRKVPGLRLIPYKTVGSDGDLMLAMRFDKVRVNGVERSMIVGFAPGELGEGQYQALVGGFV